ncbi:hypothetical protein NC652_023198 [Populus alba x Populus x berolinensis]|nr:hypothetical protein NC652_023198 [Populus alba x Populus x berolinensis]
MLERQKLVEADMKERAQDKVNDSSFLGQANSMTPAFSKAVQRRLLHMFEASMEKPVCAFQAPGIFMVSMDLSCLNPQQSQGRMGEDFSSLCHEAER